MNKNTTHTQNKHTQMKLENFHQSYLKQLKCSQRKKERKKEQKHFNVNSRKKLRFLTANPLSFSKQNLRTKNKTPKKDKEAFSKKVNIRLSEDVIIVQTVIFIHFSLIVHSLQKQLFIFFS